MAIILEQPLVANSMQLVTVNFIVAMNLSYRVAVPQKYADLQHLLTVLEGTKPHFVSALSLYCNLL